MTAQRLVNEAAKRAGFWPQLLFHQGPPGIKQCRESMDGELGRGIYLTASEDYAQMIREIKSESTFRYVVYAKFINPYRIDNSVRISLNLATSAEIRPKLESLGYDGIIRDSFQILAQQVLVFSPSQVKSAEAVCYDDQRQVVPLSHRFRHHIPTVLTNDAPLLPNESTKKASGPRA